MSRCNQADLKLNSLFAELVCTEAGGRARTCTTVLGRAVHRRRLSERLWRRTISRQLTVVFNYRRRPQSTESRDLQHGIPAETGSELTYQGLTELEKRREKFRITRPNCLSITFHGRATVMSDKRLLLRLSVTLHPPPPSPSATANPISCQVVQSKDQRKSPKCYTKTQVIHCGVREPGIHQETRCIDPVDGVRGSTNMEWRERCLFRAFVNMVPIL